MSAATVTSMMPQEKSTPPTRPRAILIGNAYVPRSSSWLISGDQNADRPESSKKTCIDTKLVQLKTWKSEILETSWDAAQNFNKSWAAVLIGRLLSRANNCISFVSRPNCLASAGNTDCFLHVRMAWKQIPHVGPSRSWASFWSSLLLGDSKSAQGTVVLFLFPLGDSRRAATAFRFFELFFHS